MQVTPTSYPLDLYILMDLSQSMRDDLEQVRELIDELGKYHHVKVLGCQYIRSTMTLWFLHKMYRKFVYIAYRVCAHVINSFDILFELTATRLDRITSDFHLGFGAFNEKPIIPFTFTRQTILRDQVVNSTDYSYRHIVSLTNNITKFRVCYMSNGVSYMILTAICTRMTACCSGLHCLHRYFYK